MKDKALQDYDIARKKFLGEVKTLISSCQREVKECLHEPEQRDYLMYLGANLATMAEYVANHDLATFEKWKKEFMGGRRACESLEDC